MSAKTPLQGDYGFGSPLQRRYPNLIKDAEIDDLDQAWTADITYVRLPTSFCYLAAILDAYSHKCVGWHLSRFIDTRLTLRALEMALAARWPAAGVIHHSDQGVQLRFNWSSQQHDVEVLVWADRRDGQLSRQGVLYCARRDIPA